MRIPYKTKLLLAMSICTLIFIAGCVDTSVQSIPPRIDYSSQIKIVNLVTGAGTATLTLNGQSLGTADFGNEVPGSQPAFLTIPSGNKTLGAIFPNVVTDENQEYKFAYATDYKYRTFMVGTAVTDTFSISSVTKSADTIFVKTSASNHLMANQQVKIEGVVGMTDLNKMVNILSIVDTTTFTVLLTTSQNYTSGGEVIKTFFNTNVFNVTQRYVWQTKDSPNGASLFPPDTGQVAFFNGSPDAVLNSVTITGASDTTVEFDSPLAMGDGVPYTKLKSGSYTFDVLYNDTEHVIFNYTLDSKGRYTAVIYDAATSIKNAVFIDD